MGTNFRQAELCSLIVQFLRILAMHAAGVPQTCHLRWVVVIMMRRVMIS